jgi:hypothetical protein
VRHLNPVLAIGLVVAVISSYSYAQTNERPPSEGQFEPFHKHHDTHFGHDHFYPDRGSIVREIPKEAASVSYAGLSYKFYDGIWYEPRGPALMVVAPPIGVVVQALPTFATVLARGGQVYIYCNDVYYRPRPDVNGYEVVNDPAEATFQLAAETQTGATAIASVSPAQPVATPLEETAIVSAPTPVGATPAPADAPAPPPPPPSVAAPASPIVPSSSAVSVGLKVALAPKQGQSAQQQARDRYECYRFAVVQSGFDPMRGSNAASQSDYERAQAACFDGRGYSVR